MTNRKVDAKGNIKNSIVITGDGNHAVLNFGGAFTLPLERKQISPPARKQPNASALPNLLSLLAPDANKLPLVGRADLLGELQVWLDHDVDVSVETLIARAGSGKTRLAVELCKQVDGKAVRDTTGWLAGFIRPTDLAAVAKQLATTAYHWPQPTLLVVDYAAAVHRPLADWLDRLASTSFDGKLRLLLLEREAPDGFGWWHDLSRPPGNNAATRRDLLVDPERPRTLPDLDPGKVRHDLLIATQAAAQAMIGEGANRATFAPFGSDASFDEALAAPRFGNPLNLAMAGIIAAQRGPSEAFGLRRLDAARHLARHEIKRIAMIATGDGIAEDAACHALGFNNLCGGMALESIIADLENELTTVGHATPAGALAKLMQQELPSPGGQEDGMPLRLGTTQPDLIGEGVIVETLLKGTPAQIVAAPKLVERTYALTGQHAAESLMRLIQDYGHALEDGSASAEDRAVGATILNLFTALAKAIPDDEIVALDTLISAMPANSLVLREVAAEQSARLANLWSVIAQSTSDEDALNRAAGWQNNLANRLSDLGQREAALAAAQEAVDLYRALAAARPDAFTPDLAGSLNNLASFLSDLGQREAALIAAQEAVDLRRALAAVLPDAFTPNLAMSLNNLANMLSALGQREAALIAAQEAVDLRRALAAARPDAFTPNLAMSLSVLADRLEEVDRITEAVAADHASVSALRPYFLAQPGAFDTPMMSYLRDYIRRAEAAGIAIDELLVMPIFEMIQSLQAGEGQ